MEPTNENLAEMGKMLRGMCAIMFAIEPERFDIRVSWKLDDPPTGRGTLRIETDLDGKTPPAEINAKILEVWEGLCAIATVAGAGPIAITHGTTEDARSQPAGPGQA